MSIFQGVIGIHFLASSEQPAELSIWSILWQKIHVVNKDSIKLTLPLKKDGFPRQACPFGFRPSFRGELAVSF